MTLFVQPRLVNGPFCDPALYLDFRFRRRALLFDLGDVSALSSREILRLSHVFVSHMHMDHFAGFDHLLRLLLNRDARLVMVGPPGLAQAVEAKLGAYTWNLLGEDSRDFSIAVSDWAPTGFQRSSLFRARSAFRRIDVIPAAATGRLLLDDPEFRIEAEMLDHGVPSLAFAFQEKLRVNVHRRRLDELGLPVGPWLTEAKRAVRLGASETDIFVPTAGQAVSIGELLDAGALVTGPGQRIVYATDLAFDPANVERLADLARGASDLFIEAAFLDEDRLLALARRHLTAAQAGRIAAMAGVARAEPLHFSPRYVDREGELRSEFLRFWRRGGLAAEMTEDRLA